MTADSRFDRELPAILEDLYLGPSPDYRHEVMAAAVRMRQRPSWTFAGRWFPMADIVTRSVTAPRVPWRAIGMAILIVALALAAVALVAGARQTKVPPPFGPARNGLITYAADGDIYVADPVSGTAKAVVTGSAGDSDPVFSPDGTRVAFRRASLTSGSPAADIVVVNADGSNAVVVTADPIPGGPAGFQWAPDSRSLLTDPGNDSAIWLLDAAAAVAPRTLATDATAHIAAFQPPDGKAILINRATNAAQQLLVLNIATGKETALATGGPHDDLGAARWSPDGSHVVYNAAPALDVETQRLFTVAADGTGTKQITDAPGTWYDIDASWSPDGSRIAFGRYEHVGTDWLVRPIGIYSVADGSVVSAGPVASDVRAQAPGPGDTEASAGEGMYPDWSPDGKSVIAYPSEANGHPVLINPLDGTWRILPLVASPSASSQAWQRLAP